MDLIDMSTLEKDNNNVKFINTVIDVISKYGWLLLVINKKGETIAQALQELFTTSKRFPKKIWADKGKEWYNKEVKNILSKNNNIILYSTENDQKASVVERWIRTMKERIYKSLTANSTRAYIDTCDSLVNMCNNSIHRAIKTTRVKACKKSNEPEVFKTAFSTIYDTPIKPKVAKVDLVRIGKKKQAFEKGYTTNWTEEVFKIIEVLNTNPPTYKIVGLNDEAVYGSFYEQEMQKTTQDVHRVEKVIKTRANKAFVKWVGYPETLNSLIDKSELESIKQA